MNDEAFKTKAPELLQDMAAHVQAVLVEYGEIDPTKANSLGEEAVERVARAWGGATVYFPKGDYIRSHRKAQEVWRDYNGRNAQEIARKHGISLVWAYDIIKKKRLEEQARRQMRLFTDDAGKTLDGER